MYYDQLGAGSVYRREPTHEEITAATTQIERSLAEIGVIQAKVFALQDQIRVLRAQEIAIRGVVNYHNGVLTLARRIPQELLADIFMLCVQSGWTRAPLVVSQVCSQWRIASKTPQIWSHIFMSVDDPNVNRRTRFWLGMACSTLLHLTLSASGQSRRSQITDIMTLLLLHANKWADFTFDVTSSVHLQSALSCCESRSFPELRAITVHSRMSVNAPIDGDAEDILLADIFPPHRAPNLASSCIRCTVLPGGVALPAQIRSLKLFIQESSSLQPLSEVQLLDLLDSLPVLVELTLSLPLQSEHPFIAGAHTARVAELGSLHLLTLHGPTDLNNLLAHLWAPSLIELRLRSLEDVGYRQTPVGPSLLPFLHSSSRVERLELYDIDLSPEFFASCLSGLENLQELCLHESSISAGTLRLLGGRGVPGSLSVCPRLAKLDLRWCGHLPGQSIVDLVRSRLPSPHLPPDAVSPIVEVVVINCCFVEEKHIFELAQMTVCRVVLRETDYCYERRCCDNLRYRQRLKFRHLTNSTRAERLKFKLVI